MVLIISRNDVQNVLTMKDAIKVVETAFKEFGTGNAWMPTRISTTIPEHKGWIGVMPGYLKGMGALATKIVSDFRENVSRYRLPTIMGIIILNDPNTGEPLSIMDGGLITAIRTGAVAGVAAKYLSRSDAEVVGIFGAGVQARAQLNGLCEVRKIKRVKVYDISLDMMKSFTTEMSTNLGIDVEIHDDPKNVVKGSQVIVTASTSNKPVFKGEWMDEGTHVNAIGAHSPTTREIDTYTIMHSKVIVDSIDTALEEAGDILIPLTEKAITKDHIYAELGEIASGIKPGRCSMDERTVFKSVGLSIQDVATAHLVYQKAKNANVGTEVNFF